MMKLQDWVLDEKSVSSSPFGPVGKLGIYYKLTNNRIFYNIL